MLTNLIALIITRPLVAVAPHARHDSHDERERDCPQGVKGLPWQQMPQLDTVPIDRYIVDTLMRDLVGHDRQPSAYLVYVFLWHETHGRKLPAVQVALFDIAEGVGLSKRGVQDALGHLSRRKL